MTGGAPIEASPRSAKSLSLERSAMRRRVLLFVAMIAAVAIVGVTLYLDARREASAALADFADEQATLAEAVATKLGDAPMSMAIAEIEEPGTVFVLVADSSGTLRRPDGGPVVSDVLTTAIANEDRTATLSRAQAAAVGLPARTAVAGIARTADKRPVAVIATAVRVRDREIRAQKRLLLGIILAALLVGGFGGIALRIQSKEHTLQRELLVAQTAKESEDRLARADKLATMGAFATGIAHEIATPLGVIAARAEMLTPRPGADETAAKSSSRAAQAILEQTDKIRGIIKSFLALARGEAPPGARLSPVDLLSSATRMVEHRFAAAGVTLDVDVTSSPAVFGEPRLLEQAMVNLLLNACDASKPGQHVRASLREKDGWVCISIEDEGVGIEPAALAHATEPFFTTKAEGRGTGLGLAIANEIAKHHQGRFIIRPREDSGRPAGNRGTEARLELPAAGDARKLGKSTERAA